MALFPLHQWLPNAYATAPSMVAAFLAATATKVSVCVLLRVYTFVFGAEALFDRLPTGALLGLDAVSAAAEGNIQSVRMTTRKPPKGLEGAPHLVANRIDITNLTAPKLVFSGSAREAAIGFPANVNVAAALSLAGIGPDRTMIEVWADPGVTRNCHRIEVEADSARFTLEIENVPSENPKTGRITALSVVAALRKLHAPLRVGT